MIGLMGLTGCSSKKAPTTSKSAWVSDIPAGGFNKFTEQEGKLVIVDFSADWCGPCRRLAPILDQIAEERRGEVVVGKVNVDHFSDVASREGVDGIPDVRLYRDGKMVDRFVGLPLETELRRRIDEHSKNMLQKAKPDPEKSPTRPTSEPIPEPMKKDWVPEGLQRR